MPVTERTNVLFVLKMRVHSLDEAKEIEIEDDYFLFFKDKYSHTQND